MNDMFAHVKRINHDEIMLNKKVGHHFYLRFEPGDCCKDLLECHLDYLR